MVMALLGSAEIRFGARAGEFNFELYVQLRCPARSQRD